MTDMDRYAVIGNPVAHSKSPQIHQWFAAASGQRIDYQRRLAPLDGFAVNVRDFIAAGGRGANVTVPFKLQAAELATRVSVRAAIAGAVNTLTFDGAEILGDNTDGVGLVADIVGNAGVTLRGRRVLLLGAGGAARGVLQPLLEQQPAWLQIANRSQPRADALVRHFGARTGLGASDFASLAPPFDVIINATSASLQGQALALPSTVFDGAALAYDMMYGVRPSAFLRAAAAYGVPTRDGLGMLVEQAAEAFLIWRGVRPATAGVYRRLRAELAASAAPQA
jgi:shikimate dehydrogenase